MSQIELFPVPTTRRRLEVLSEFAWSEEFAEAMLDVARSRQTGEWIYGTPFHHVAQSKYDCGHLFGHVLSKLVREGKLLEKKVYFGTENPCDPGEYLGFTYVYMLPPEAAV